MSKSVIRRMPRPEELSRMTTEEVRDAFLVAGLFAPGEVRLQVTDLDRFVLGGVVPAGSPLALPGQAGTGTGFFLERRELGAFNVGGPGVVRVDGKSFPADSLSCLYAGAGSREVVFESVDPKNPAKFFLLSCPAHAPHPAALARREEAASASLGSAATANARTIRRYIHAGGIRSCQLVLGCTELAEGSVWNTFPPHTHDRRTEVYFYFGLGDNVLAHFLGAPSASRHCFVGNEQAVLSPSWSIHMGCGTAAYKFLWGMAGENQVFEDMDPVRPGALR